MTESFQERRKIQNLKRTEQFCAGIEQTVNKETAMRIGEAWRLQWTDIDTERNIITLNQPEKGSRTRIFKVSPKLMGMLQNLPKGSQRVFKGNLSNKQKTFTQTRKRIANCLQNPRILKIRFHTFRHWKATTLYHKTHDPLYVMNFLGHNDLRSTLIYINLEKVIFNEQNDEFHVKVAKSLEDACKLAEVGFEYFTTIDGTQILRKRK